jgi:hypothetical protein
VGEGPDEFEVDVPVYGEVVAFGFGSVQCNFSRDIQGDGCAGINVGFVADCKFVDAA